MDQTQLNATVTERMDLTQAPDIVRITPVTRCVPTFQAGQFCTLGLPADHPHTTELHQANNHNSAVVSEYLIPQLIRRVYNIATLTDLPTIPREPAASKWPGLRGRVQGLLDATRFCFHTKFELSPKTCEVYLCGNPQMIESIIADLQNRGFTPQKTARKPAL